MKCYWPDKNIPQKLSGIIKNFELEVVHSDEQLKTCALTQVDDFLALKFSSSSKLKPFYIDFEDNYWIHKAKTIKASDLIAKAIGFKGKSIEVFDLTAGWLSDGFHLSHLGCQLKCFEENPWVFCLVRDALDRCTEQWVNNIHLINLSAESQLETLSEDVVVYFDPMYAKTKKSALPSKEMQIMSLLGVESNEERNRSIVEKIRQKKGVRLVVKRPPNGPQIVDDVTHSFKGKSVRYDLYL